MKLQEKPPDRPSYAQALEIALANAPTLGDEEVPLSEARGRYLRAPILADRDQPPFNRSAMDGFAVRSDQIARGRRYAIAANIPAGASTPDVMFGENDICRIATGSAVPEHFDAVIPIEEADVIDDDHRTTVRFTLDEVPKWKNIHQRGSDTGAGEEVVARGTRLEAQHIGIAAAVGRTSVTVTQPPRITLLTTGDEVQPTSTATEALEPQQIRNSNGPMLRAFFDSLGAPVLEHVHVPDEPEQTRAAAREALSRSHLVVTVGGISVGQRDLLPDIWRSLGLNVLIHGVLIQPGKPLFVATPSTEKTPDNKLVIGLPGNPVSALVCAHLFIRPLIDAMMRGGIPDSEDDPTARRPWRPVELTADVKANPKRRLFRAARINADGRAEAIAWQGSGDLVHTATAEGVIALPQQAEPIKHGITVPFLGFSCRV